MTCVCSEKKVCHSPGLWLCEYAARQEGGREVAGWTLAKEATLQQVSSTARKLHRPFTPSFDYESILIKLMALCETLLTNTKVGTLVPHPPYDRICQFGDEKPILVCLPARLICLIFFHLLSRRKKDAK